LASAKRIYLRKGDIYIKGYVYTTYILHWTSLRRETLISFLPSPFLFVNFLFLSRLALISSGCSTFILGFKSKERLKLKFSFPDCWYLVGSWSLSLFCFFASDIPPFSYVVFMQCSVHIHGTDYVFQVWMSESFRPSFHLSFSFFFSFYIAISSFIFGRAPSVLIIYSLPVSYFLSPPPPFYLVEWAWASKGSFSLPYNPERKSQELKKKKKKQTYIYTRHVLSTFNRFCPGRLSLILPTIGLYCCCWWDFLTCTHVLDATPSVLFRWTSPSCLVWSVGVVCVCLSRRCI
jgi:hypothetical protein